jgi:hypothetical protein
MDGTKGFFRVYAKAFAKDTPTTKDRISPGVRVKDMKSTLLGQSPSCLKEP